MAGRERKNQSPVLRLCDVSDAALDRVVGLAGRPELLGKAARKWEAEAEPLGSEELLRAQAAGPAVLERVLAALEQLDRAMRERFQRWGCGVIELVRRGGPKPLEIRAWAMDALRKLRRLLPLLSPASRSAPAQLRPRALTRRQQEVWDLLNGQAMMATEIAKSLRGKKTQEHAIRKLIEKINKGGREIRNEPRVGYYRPDAPAPG